MTRKPARRAVNTPGLALIIPPRPAGDPMTDQTTETARALLYRHGLPEDVIDGALCLHAQELAAEIREETRRLKEHGVLEPWKYRPCRDAANQIDPARNEDDVDPDEAAVPLPPADQTTPASAETLEALSDTLYDALYAITPFAEKYFADEREGLQNAVRAVLAAAVPAAVDRAAEVAPATTCSAQYHGPGEDGARLCIRVAQHERTAHTDEYGFHWSDTVAMYPVADGTFRTGTDVRAVLRRVADETAATETRAGTWGVCQDCGAAAGPDCDCPPFNGGAESVAGARQDGAQSLPTPAETAPADESPHAYMDAVQDSAAWAYALTKAGQTAEALEHVEAMERLLAVYRRAVGA